MKKQNKVHTINEENARRLIGQGSSKLTKEQLETIIYSAYTFSYLIFERYKKEKTKIKK